MHRSKLVFKRDDGKANEIWIPSVVESKKDSVGAMKAARSGRRLLREGKVVGVTKRPRATNKEEAAGKRKLSLKEQDLKLRELLKTLHTSKFAGVINPEYHSAYFDNNETTTKLEEQQDDEGSSFFALRGNGSSTDALVRPRTMQSHFKQALARHKSSSSVHPGI